MANPDFRSNLAAISAAPPPTQHILPPPQSHFRSNLPAISSAPPPTQHIPPPLQSHFRSNLPAISSAPPPTQHIPPPLQSHFRSNLPAISAAPPPTQYIPPPLQSHFRSNLPAISAAPPPTQYIPPPLQSHFRSNLAAISSASQPPPPQSSAHHCDDKWKQKAKKRKQELIRLREDLQLAEDNSNCDLFPKYAACKCYFFDNLGEITNPSQSSSGPDWRFNDVLLRRFLRQVRLNERKRTKDGSRREHLLSDFNSEDEAEQLRSAVDFLVDLCDSASADKTKEMNFFNLSHQAVDFILGAIKNIVAKGENMELFMGTVSNLIVRLVRKMCTFSGGDDIHHYDTDAAFYIQHLIRKLGSESFIGQRVILAVSQRVSILGESFLFMDPFHIAFPSMHDCLYIMIQLIEFLITDYTVTWSSNENFEIGLFEEWVKSLLHARKALHLLETRNGLYVMYMDRVVGHVAKYVGQVPSLRKLDSDILSTLFS